MQYSYVYIYSKDNGILLAWNVGFMEGLRLQPLMFLKPLIFDKDEKIISVVLIHMLLVHYNTLGNGYEPPPPPNGTLNDSISVGGI